MLSNSFISSFLNGKKDGVALVMRSNSDNEKLEIVSRIWIDACWRRVSPSAYFLTAE